MRQETIPHIELQDSGADFVARQRLVTRAQASPDTTLLVVAPSGYGKTVLLRQIAEHDERESVTILLDQRFNDATLLARTIAEAVGGAAASAADLDDALKAPSPDIAAVAPRLIALLASRPSGVVLTLDELEWIDSAATNELVAALAERMPAGSRLAIATRNEPHFQLGRLRASRGLVELRRQDLVMTAPECAGLLRSLDIVPTPRQLDSLVRRTEGWPAALYLAGLALADAPDLGRAISRFAGDDRIVVEYLREEFLLQLPPERLEFLTRSAVLDRMSGEICDAVLQREGSAALLVELAEANSLVIPIDRSNRWFRLHPLLRDMLLAELSRNETGLFQQLNLRAADWWEQAGNTDQAVDHAIAAGDARRAGALTWAAVPTYLPNGRLNTVSSWLEQLGEARVATDPGLALTASWAELTTCNGAAGERWMTTAQSLIAKQPDSPAKLALIGGVMLVHATLARNGLAAAREAIAQVEPLLSEDDPWRSLCCLLDGTALQLMEKPAEARLRLREGVRRGAVAAPNLQVICLAQLAMLALDADDLVAAETKIQRARAQIERTGLGDYPMVALAYAASALIRSFRGDLAGASADLAQAENLLGDIEDFADWYEIETRVTMARAYLRVGDRATCERLIGEVVHRLERVPDGALLEHWLDLARGELAASGDAAILLLTPAELRVLALLPTHMSLPQIGESLHISANTVKTHVRNIYRKLDASSREGAVGRARELGLLTGAVGATN